MAKRILHVVTNVAHYQDPTQPTGLWLSELTHAWQIFAANGYEQRIVSPLGGLSAGASLTEMAARRCIREGLAGRPRADGAAGLYRAARRNRSGSV